MEKLNVRFSDNAKKKIDFVSSLIGENYSETARCALSIGLDEMIYKAELKAQNEEYKNIRA